MNKYIICFFIIIIIAGQLDIFGQKSLDGNTIIGNWMDEKEKSAIKIYKNKDVFEGKIVWLKVLTDSNGNAVRDVNNEDESLRNRYINGLKVLSGLSYEGDGKWEDGKLYIPKLGETLSCDIECISNDTVEVNVYYYGISQIGKKIKWIRQ